MSPACTLSTVDEQHFRTNAVRMTDATSESITQKFDDAYH